MGNLAEAHNIYYSRRHGNFNKEIKIAGVRADPKGEYLSE